MLERLGIITDEVSPVLDDALTWIRERNLHHVEIRMVDGRNVIALTDDEAREVRRRVEAHGLYVAAIASPVFKCPLDPNRAVAGGDTFGQSADEDVARHFELLERAIEIARLLGTTRIRIFSFWREEQPEQYEAEIAAHLKRAADIAQERGCLLLLENEPSCNGGHAAEVGRLAERVDSAALRVLWDPGNEAYTGRTAFPDGYEAVKRVLAHVHLKDAIHGPDGAKCVPIGEGTVDFPGQLAALERNGYDGLYSIETHYVPPGGTTADGSAQSLLGLRRLLGEPAE
ncbi:MAG: sugar phosphate isomerase/epimerase [Paenibacillaceae bacterium]|nr:sugar phosphate isomerase/epimerase [Paenibacillaceae bacterium]